MRLSPWRDCNSMPASGTPSLPARVRVDARRQFDQVEAGTGDVEHG
jgi:hypothetical protein